MTTSKSRILTPRPTYMPFLYPQAAQFAEQQQQSHWLASEISLASDINDWKLVLTEAEKQVIGHTLKGFTQTEVFISDYWATLVYKWFRHPEISLMASTFSAMEAIHGQAYSLLDQSLGLDNYEAFLAEPTVKAKIDRLIGTRGKTVREIATSLAVFSGFAEGVQLFSAFAILLNFSRFNKMKGLGEIITFSQLDESVHSTAGCWLFRTLIEENPQVWDDELKKEIYEAARLTVSLEDDFIDKAFSLGPVQGLDPADLKAFIRHRCNTRLQDLGLKSNWKNIDKQALKNMEWYSALGSKAVAHHDFFATRGTYTKGTHDFSKIVWA